MKVYAQSTLADGNPYIHLGYTSATPRNLPMAVLSGMVILLGVVMAYSVVTGVTKSGFTTINLVRRKSMALVLGGYAVLIAGCVSLALSWPHPPMETRRDAQAAANMKRAAASVFLYAASWNDALPARIGNAIADKDFREYLRDPRLEEAPITAAESETQPADGDAPCDFYYTGTGVTLNKLRHPSTFILLYDQPDAGTNRIVALADGHVEILPAGSPQLDRLVEDTNKQRAEMKLPPLPAGLAGPPPEVP